jgi:FkbM family methyltransferase
MISPFRIVGKLYRVPELLVARQQTPAFSQLTARYFEIGTPLYPFDIPLSGGGTLRVSSPGELKVFWEIFVRRCYRPPADCRIVLDAGANVGIFSVWAAKRLPEARIIAVEPFPETAAAFRHNVLVNQLEERVQLIQVGLAAQSGDCLMRSQGESPDRKLMRAGEDEDAGYSVRVPCLSLVALLDQLRLASVDFLEMDIQGCEWEVLLSTPTSVLRSIHRIQFEYHEVRACLHYIPERLFAHLGMAGHVLIYRREDEHKTGLAIFERAGHC